LKKLISSGDIPDETLRPPIAAVSVGIVNQQAMLDLNYKEDSQADVDINIVKTSTGQFIEIQGTAENQTFSPKDLHQMLDLGDKGIGEIIALQEQILQSNL